MFNLGFLSWAAASCGGTPASRWGPLLHTHMVVVCGTTVKESERDKKPRHGVRAEGEVPQADRGGGGGCPMALLCGKKSVAGSTPGLAAALQVDPCWCPPPSSSPQPPFTVGYTWLASFNQGRWGEASMESNTPDWPKGAQDDGRWGLQCPVPW